mmetsp:Transcript_21632/g.43724  ORF Transcript_21632/g.43724 Transcript_21632/m.43724 type:complete len:207 (-) Transcript_21632:470-1090(-)
MQMISGQHEFSMKPLALVQENEGTYNTFRSIRTLCAGQGSFNLVRVSCPKYSSIGNFASHDNTSCCFLLPLRTVGRGITPISNPVLPPLMHPVPYCLFPIDQFALPTLEIVATFAKVVEVCLFIFHVQIFFLLSNPIRLRTLWLLGIWVSLTAGVSTFLPTVKSESLPQGTFVFIYPISTKCLARLLVLLPRPGDFLLHLSVPVMH